MLEIDMSSVNLDTASYVGPMALKFYGCYSYAYEALTVILSMSLLF